MMSEPSRELSDRQNRGFGCVVCGQSGGGMRPVRMLNGHGQILAHEVCAVAAGEPGWLDEGCPGGHLFSDAGPDL